MSIRKLLTCLKNDPIQSALDLGCGDAKELFWLHHNMGVKLCVGVDHCGPFSTGDETPVDSDDTPFIEYRKYVADRRFRAIHSRESFVETFHLHYQYKRGFDHYVETADCSKFDLLILSKVLHFNKENSPLNEDEWLERFRNLINKFQRGGWVYVSVWGSLKGMETARDDRFYEEYEKIIPVPIETFRKLSDFIDCGYGPVLCRQRDGRELCEVLGKIRK